MQSSEATLPYELLALEASLAAHTRGLEAETAELEGQAKPSLERLLLSVCPCHKCTVSHRCTWQHCVCNSELLIGCPDLVFSAYIGVKTALELRPCEHEIA